MLVDVSSYVFLARDVIEIETKPILGIYALETLGFKVNPLTGDLDEIPEGDFFEKEIHR